MQPFLHQPWWRDLAVWQQEALELSYHLYQREIDQKTHFPDYAYIIFPAAKAYEGFLKDLFYKMKLIGSSDEESNEKRDFVIPTRYPTAVGQSLCQSAETHHHITIDHPVDRYEYLG